MRAVFFDRDGTLNVDAHYIVDPEKLVLYPGAAAGIAGLRRAGYASYVVTNQSQVGRGWASVEQIEAVNRRFIELLRRENADAMIEEIFCCYHGPDENCGCRKPHTGLIQRLIVAKSFDPKTSWVVGDKLSDLKFGENAGIPKVHQILVRTGQGEADLKKSNAAEIVVASEVSEAIQMILAAKDERGD